MFAQLLITLALVWIIAEVLCRWILGRPVAAAARELFGLADERSSATAKPRAIEPNASLRRLLADRQRELAETGDRLELAAETADVSERLALREAELAVTEGRLAEIEHQRSGKVRD